MGATPGRPTPGRRAMRPTPGKRRTRAAPWTPRAQPTPRLRIRGPSETGATSRTGVTAAPSRAAPRVPGRPRSAPIAPSTAGSEESARVRGPLQRIHPRRLRDVHVQLPERVRVPRALRGLSQGLGRRHLPHVRGAEHLGSRLQGGGYLPRRGHLSVTRCRCPRARAGRPATARRRRGYEPSASFDFHARDRSAQQLCLYAVPYALIALMVEAPAFSATWAS